MSRHQCTSCNCSAYHGKKAVQWMHSKNKNSVISKFYFCSPSFHLLHLLCNLALSSLKFWKNYAARSSLNLWKSQTQIIRVDRDKYKSLCSSRCIRRGWCRVYRTCALRPVQQCRICRLVAADCTFVRDCLQTQFCDVIGFYGVPLVHESSVMIDYVGQLRSKSFGTFFIFYLQTPPPPRNSVECSHAEKDDWVVIALRLNLSYFSELCPCIYDYR